MDKKNTNLDELLKVIAASGAGIPIAGIRVMVKKADEEEPVSHEAVGKETVGKVATPTAESMDAPAEPAKPAPGSAGELKLHDVDPRDAAMIMAIVANKMGKPINELRFKSIKEVK